jgi:hypothetical protein
MAMQDPAARFKRLGRSRWNVHQGAETAVPDPGSSDNDPKRDPDRGSTPRLLEMGRQILLRDRLLARDQQALIRDPLPMKGKFQLLANGTTEFGPGDRGYLGGRWWEDLNGNGVQDAADHYFLCPLLPPGRESP